MINEKFWENGYFAFMSSIAMILSYLTDENLYVILGIFVIISLCKMIWEAVTK